MRMLSAIRIRRAMEKVAFINHIVYSSGASTGKTAKTGAATLVELMKVANLVSEQDGQIIALDNDSVELESKVNKDIEQTQSGTYDSTIHSQSICTPVGTVCININVNVDINELEELPEKLKILIEGLK